jgi:hypothetical protein
VSLFSFASTVRAVKGTFSNIEGSAFKNVGKTVVLVCYSVLHKIRVP